MTTTATSAPEYPRAALPPAKGRAGLGGAVRSEWTKIRTLRSTYWTIFALAVIALGIGAAITGGGASELSAHHRQPVNFDATQTSLFALIYLGALVMAVLGAMVITSEYSTGMIRTSLTAQPRRGVVYASKVIVYAVVAFVVAVVIAFVAFFIGQSLLASANVSTTLSHPYTVQAILGAAAYVTVAGLMAFGIGAIVRHTAGAITIAVALLFVVQILVNLLPSDWAADTVRWLPTSSWTLITTTVGPRTDPHLFAPWTQFGVTAGWAVVLLIVGGILFRTRDALSPKGGVPPPFRIPVRGAYAAPLTPPAGGPSGPREGAFGTLTE